MKLHSVLNWYCQRQHFSTVTVLLFEQAFDMEPDLELSPLQFSLSPITPDGSFLSPIGEGGTTISPAPDRIIFSPISSRRNAHRKRTLFSRTTVTKPEGSLPKKRGPIPYYKKFPNLVDVTIDTLVDHGLAAHRRRSETWASVGISARNLRDQVVSKMPELQRLKKPIHPTTFANLMIPPNRSRNSRHRYHSVIQARVGIKRNDQAAENVDSHYCRTLVNYALEMATCFEDEVAIWSADDKNKLLLGEGSPCVSRMINAKTYSMIGDCNYRYNDHNYSSGYKLIPSGYMRARRKERFAPSSRRRHRSASPVRQRNAQTSYYHEDPGPASSATSHLKHDRLGRVHFRYPRTGPLTIVLRGNKFFKATVYNHYDDLEPLLRKERDEEGRYAAVIVTDNGSDWSKNSLKVLVSLGRLWRDLSLDYLCVVAYCPGDSKYNMIEHSWSPTTLWLCGLVLPATLPGESKTPDQQKNLTEAEKREKEAQVFDNASKDVKRCLQGRKYDSFPVDVVAIPAKDTHKYQDEEMIDRLTEARVTLIRANEELKEKTREVQFLNKHAVQRRYQIEFIKCSDPRCDHCSTRPEKSKHLMEFLRQQKDQCAIPPKLSDTHLGHYDTWIEVASESIDGNTNALPDLDEGLSDLSLEVKRCPRQGCRKMFQSNMDRTRHTKLMRDLSGI